jgi:hypothetical protein
MGLVVGVVALVDVAAGRVVDGFSFRAARMAGSTRALDSPTWR